MDSISLSRRITAISLLVLTLTLSGCTFNVKTQRERDIEACQTRIAQASIKDVQADLAADAKVKPSKKVLAERSNRTLAYAEMNAECAGN